ncbi:MAG TPA: nucleoside hydrolase [Caldilineaceae bacterium]|nr:nucleoside hydrolase [Caldilineaceae bacterium]
MSSAELADEGRAGPLPVLLDVDTGFDDALALILALRSPRLRVLGVTCVVGNQRLDQVVANTLKVIEALGADVPVAAGMRLPLLEPLRTPMPLHGQDGMADLALPAPRGKPLPIHAVEFLRQTLLAASEPVTVIALAPLTNLALLIRMYPEAAERIANLVIMGGTLAGAGNVTPVAEFNIRHDPEAAAMVLGSELPICLYPLDVFRQIAFSRGESEAMAALADPAPRLAGGILCHSCTYFGSEAALIGDAGAVATVIDPAGCRRGRYAVTVELANGPARGQTVVDRRTPAAQARGAEWWPPAAPSVEIVEWVDVARYRRLFAETVGAAHLLLPAGELAGLPE